MEFLNPGLLGSRKGFRQRFLLPIQGRGDPAAAGRLRRLTAPFVLRRAKTDPTILPELPDKIERRQYCSLTPEQATLYRAVLADAEERLQGAGPGIERRGLILGLLTRLKQVCNHPAHFLGDGSPVPGRSGKLERLTELAGEMLEAGDRALVFTQYVEMGHMLRAHLQETFGREALFLHGSVARPARDEMVERFQADDPDGPAFFLLSLRAGGTGLNLTAASHVFHYDRWWNPAVEDQATDRAHRIGQARAVQVHKLVCSGTLEERIDDLIESKKEVARAVVGGGEAWITELDDDRLRELLALSEDALEDEAEDEEG
jgi:SNF2 family DNA or RNA helicase